MSEPIENQVFPNEPSNHNLDKERLGKRHRFFLVESQCEVDNV